MLILKIDSPALGSSLSIFFYICGTLFLLTFLCGEEVFSEFQPPHQCNVCLCVVCVECSSSTHTTHIFLMDRNYDWG